MSAPEGFLHQPKNTMPLINSLWAFLSVDPADGNEGVCAATIGNTLMPLIAADEARLASLRSHAEKIAKRSGRKIKLVKFTTREEVEEVG